MNPERRRNLIFALVVFAIYCGVEIVCLLFGLGALSRKATGLAMVAALTFLLGAMIEGLLTSKPGENYLDPQPEGDWKLYRAPVIKGMVYFVAPIEAYAGRIYSWELYISIIFFTGILIRVGWLVLKYVREPIGFKEE